VSPGGQPGSAGWAPADLAAEQCFDRRQIVVVQRACLAGEMDSDRFDDERCPPDWRRPILVDIGCATCDYVTIVALALVVSGRIVAVDASDSAGEATTSLDISCLVGRLGPVMHGSACPAWKTWACDSPKTFRAEGAP
jgi:hypothetical protein